MYRTFALILAHMVVTTTMAQPGLEILNSPRDERFTNTLIDSAQHISLVESNSTEFLSNSEEPSWNTRDVLFELFNFTGTDGVAFIGAVAMFAMKPMIRLLCGMKAQRTP
eukprot:symbB.v1.2.024386.t1/scaffold2305.1/size121121/9